ncbi:hypothetical protein, partial [Peribacillus frigoritolerans]|uniref:hypothetical protein n=1 Tax=Peribacillus frigoritolerans TaxID=450367 RepID=UPI002416809C
KKIDFVIDNLSIYIMERERCVNIDVYFPIYEIYRLKVWFIIGMEDLNCLNKKHDLHKSGGFRNI